MAVCLKRYLCLVFLFQGFVYPTTPHTFEITHKPDYVKINKQVTATGPVHLSHALESVSSLLGISDKSNALVASESIWKRPKAIAMFVIFGANFPATPETRFKTEVDAYPTLEAIVQRLASITQNDPLVMKLDVEQIVGQDGISSIVKEIQLDRLQEFASSFGIIDLSNQEEQQLAAEFYLVNSLVDKIGGNAHLGQNSPHLFEFVIRALASFDESAVETENDRYQRALSFTQKAVEAISEKFSKIYANDAVVMVTSLYGSPSEHLTTHKSRSLLQTSELADASSINVGSTVSNNFPVYFNQALWLVIALLLALVAICYVLWYMDPGRDSVIYRMTSQLKIKKDL